jgi:hypothetical protein
MVTTAITATMAMVLRCLALFFCVVGRIAGSFFLCGFHFGQTLRVYKNTFEKRFTGGNSADYFAVKGICLLLRCWARQVCVVFILEG